MTDSDNMSMQKILSHDEFFRLSMTNIRIATDWFRAHLPAILSSRINFETLKIEPSSFVGRHQNHLADILYSVEMDSEQGYLYALCEHKSSPERLLPLQIYRYMAEIWQHWCQQQRKNKIVIKHLPMIWPCVFYHGDRKPYPYSMDIRDCFKDRELSSRLFDHPYQLVDMSCYSDEELKAHGTADAFEMIQKHIFDRDNFAFYQEFCQNVLQSAVDALGDEYLINLMRYAIGKGEGGTDNADRLIELVATSLPKKGGKFMTMLEALEKRGEERGVQKGIQKGIQKGAEQQSETIARNLLINGSDVAFVAKVTGLSQEKIEAIHHAMQGGDISGDR